MFDLMNFFATAFPVGKSEWTTPNEIVHQDKAIILRCFRFVKGSESTVIIPAQSGHSSHIADHDKGQSVVETAMKNQPGSVYCIEWLPCTPERKDEELDDLFDQLDLVVSLVGKCHLAGHSHGGLLATIYTAMRQENVYSLIVDASPIDSHASGGVIYNMITNLGMEPYRKVVEEGDGLMKGEMMLFGWKLANYFGCYVTDYVDIWTDMLLGNHEKMKKVKRFRMWRENSQDIAGAWYLQACELLFLKNLLVKGELFIKGERVQLSKITCRLGLVAGEDDDLVPKEQVFNLRLYVSSAEIIKILIPKADHHDCFMGAKAQEYIAEVVRWLHRKTVAA